MNRAAPGVFLSLVVLAAGVFTDARAEVQPGELIDKSNCERIEGLVPDFILLWVRNGDLTLEIGKLYRGSAYPLSYRKGGYKDMQVQDMDENLFSEGGFTRYLR